MIIHDHTWMINSWTVTTYYSYFFHLFHDHFVFNSHGITKTTINMIHHHHFLWVYRTCSQLKKTVAVRFVLWRATSTPKPRSSRRPSFPGHAPTNRGSLFAPKMVQQTWEFPWWISIYIGDKWWLFQWDIPKITEPWDIEISLGFHGARKMVMPTSKFVLVQ